MGVASLFLMWANSLGVILVVQDPSTLALAIEQQTRKTIDRALLLLLLLPVQAKTKHPSIRYIKLHNER
jgi:hypothetical protein